MTENKLVSIGDEICLDNKNVLVCGPGLYPSPSGDKVTVTRMGRLFQELNNSQLIESNANSYTPHNNDLVIGIVNGKRGDAYKIDINGPEMAIISTFAFEGATKRQKTNLVDGDLIYARIVLANEGLEPELVCVDSYFKSGILGELQDGFLLELNIAFANKLLERNEPLLSLLGEKFPYEIAVGVNGYTWANGRNTKEMYFLYSFLLNSQYSFMETGLTLTPELEELLT